MILRLLALLPLVVAFATEMHAASLPDAKAQKTEFTERDRQTLA